MLVYDLINKKQSYSTCNINFLLSELKLNESGYNTINPDYTNTLILMLYYFEISK